MLLVFFFSRNNPKCLSRIFNSEMEKLIQHIENLSFTTHAPAHVLSRLLSYFSWRGIVLLAIGTLEFY